MLRRFWPLIVLILAPLVALWRPVFLGETIGAVDQIQAMAPWKGPEPVQPWDVLQADSVLQFLPWRDLVFKSWAKGQLPAWNPYELAGTPLLANSQSGALYPPHIFVAPLPASTPAKIALLAWLHLALAGLGTSALCRRLGGSTIGGLIAGLSFVFSAFMLSWTALPSVIETVAWIPWALAACTGILDGQNLKSQALATAGLAGSVAMMALAGHLQFVAYGAMAIVVFAVGRAIAHRPRLTLKPTLVGIALALSGLFLGFGLAAPQLLPVLQFSQTSHRRNVPTEEGYEAYSRSAIRLWELGGAVYPKLNGDPTESVKLGEQDVSAYWPAYVRPGANFAESAIGLGPLVVCLLMCARRKAPYWRELSPLVFVGVLALLCALGTAIGRVLYFLVPGWSSSGSPGRAAVLVVLAGCVAAGVVASQPVEAKERKRRLFAPVAGFIAFSLATIYAVMYGLKGLPPGLPSLDAGLLSSIIASGIRTGTLQALVAALVNGAAVVFWIRNGRRDARWLLIPIALSPFLVLPNLVRSARGDLGIKEGNDQGRVAIVNDRWSLYGRPNAFLPPNVGSLSGIHELGGYDSLLDNDTKNLLDDANGQNSTPAENGNMLFVKSTADPAKLAAAGVTEIWTDRPNPKLPPIPPNDEGIYKYPLPGPGRVTAEIGTPTIQSESLSDIQVQAQGPGRLTLRDRNLPGWTATIDGQPAKIGGEVWRQIQLPAGTHVVRMEYSPPGLASGIRIALACLLLLGIGVALALRTTPTKPSSS